MTQDSVFIEGMRLAAHIGVTAEERDTPQVLRFDITLLCDLRRAGESDDVNDSIDYGAVYRQVVDVVESTPCKLLEHLATIIATALLTAFPACEQASVRVGKPALFPYHWTFRHAGRGNRPQPSGNDCGSANTSGLAHL